MFTFSDLFSEISVPNNSARAGVNSAPELGNLLPILELELPSLELELNWNCHHWNRNRN